MSDAPAALPSIREVVARKRDALEDLRRRYRAQTRTVDDLTDDEKGRLETVYTEARTRRPRCSREDFASGYLAALLAHDLEQSFRH